MKIKCEKISYNIIENLPHIIIYINKNLKILDMNKSARKYLKYFQEDETIQDYSFYYKKIKPMIQIIDKEEFTEDAITNSIKEGKRINKCIIKTDESLNENVKYFELNSYIIEADDETAGSVIMVKDITEEYFNKMELNKERDNLIKLSSELKTKCEIIELLRSKEKQYVLHLKNIITNISEGIIVLDQFGNFSLSNKAAYSITGLEAKDLIRFFDLSDQYIVFNELYEGLKLKELYSKYIKGHRNISKIVLKSKKNNDKKEKFIEINTTPVLQDGKFVNTIVTLKDVSEETSHNIKLQEINKMKDEFFTMTSHELRTPLTIIKSSIQLAYDVYGSEVGNNIDKTLKRINQNCSRLLKLVNNILDLSKAEAGFLEITSSYFDIVSETEQIVDSAKTYAESKGIELIFDTNEEEAEVLLDRDKYGKILLNLLSNAIKFTSEGKTIMVCMQIKKKTVSLVVEDQGIGIPKDKLDYIFERFTQVGSSLSRTAEGTGIGLSLVKKFVELMNGKITVISEIGRGSTFMIKFKRFVGEDTLTELEEHTVSNIDEKINIEFSDIN